MTVAELADEWDVPSELATAVLDVVPIDAGRGAHRAGDVVDALRRSGAGGSPARAAGRACGVWVLVAIGFAVGSSISAELRDSEHLSGPWLAALALSIAFLQDRYRLWAEAATGLQRALATVKGSDTSASEPVVRASRPTTLLALTPSFAAAIGITVGAAWFVVDGDPAGTRTSGIVAGVATVVLTLAWPSRRVPVATAT
ncbi:hypothetical protein [Actinomarinicola tropica]|uniref:hypothetical protein n=1 Tax=Actinomarinicola tropica TaxID=2789776 RepID=UPI001E44E6CF|nr:hypothetical protein [Actinomarinicola tropica]